MNFKLNIDISQDNKCYKGDAIIGEIKVNESIEDWEIRAELYDLSGNSYKIATANVTGGADSQISIDDEDNGVFTITFPNGATTSFDNEIWLEIERVDADSNKKTIFQSKLVVADEKITWTEVT